MSKIKTHDIREEEKPLRDWLLKILGIDNSDLSLEELKKKAEIERGDLVSVIPKNGAKFLMMEEGFSIYSKGPMLWMVPLNAAAYDSAQNDNAAMARLARKWRNR
jgi:hypothetical protein